MIKVKTALQIILNSIKENLGSEEVALLDSLDRILSIDIPATSNLPAFDNSAMDGYCLKAKDTKKASRKNPKVLSVIEDVPAGYVAKRKVADNEAIRIMTGAPLPFGADSVVMVEFTQKIEDEKQKSERVRIFKEVKRGENIRRSGEDVKKGQRVLLKGCFIRPQELGMLAALGIQKIKAMKRPRVGILATGDELASIKEKKLANGKIRNSNSFILSGQITKCGAIPVDLGIAKDTKNKVRNKIERGLNKHLDMLLVLGGISVGDYDLVKVVLSKLGMKMKFWRVAMRPGKPLAFGLLKGIPVFGLPGNPVSSTITFEEFVRPALLKMQGAKNLFRPGVWAILTEEFAKKKGLRYFIRAKVKNKNGLFFAHPTGSQGSGLISSLVLADGIMVVPEEIEYLKKGQKVYVQLLRYGYETGAI